MRNKLKLLFLCVISLAIKAILDHFSELYYKCKDQNFLTCHPMAALVRVDPMEVGPAANYKRRQHSRTTAFCHYLPQLILACALPAQFAGKVE